MLLRRIRWIIGLTHHKNSSSSSSSSSSYSNHPKRLPDAPRPPPLPPKRKQQPMLDAVHEIAIYIHRFHNLDLFQQGWYQIKITMRWEDGDNNTSLGTPARVVQYQAPDVDSDDIYGVWRIDDTDHSFSTQPFRIRYARQDILLSVMIAFNLSLGKYEGLPTSAVILKFELMYAPVLENGSGLQASLDAFSASVHEFRIPPKALLGLHSYCPVHFDSFHAVLVDITIHISLLKGVIHTASAKVPSDSSAIKGDEGENFDKSKQVMVVRALLTSRDILLEELQNLSKAINQMVDLADFTSNLDDSRLFSSSREAVLETSHAVVSAEASSKPQTDSEKPNGIIDFRSNEFFHSLSKDELLKSFHSLGSQVLYLWNTFLKFHRANETKISEFLRDAWANDRRAEWSIWMVYSKVDMPHQYIRSGVDDSYHGACGKASALRKLTDDPAQSAAVRAELHRRSIEQMRINNRSIQDMHIFGDPSRIPIIIVEHVVNAPLRSTIGNSYFSNFNQKDASPLLADIGSKAKNKLSAPKPQQRGRVLKIVVFVHGFQGHHLDLRLIRNQWLLLDPKIEFLMSEVNEDKTSGDFREMGLRLAQEVTSFIKKKMDKASRSGSLRSIKLSFVGHSIGNVIIRTALAEDIMEPYLRHLYTYLSISGPHLGYLYSSNSLFNSGLWLLKKFKGTQCIHQLTHTDDPDLQNTFLYKLCKQKTLENFKNIILLSSPQDGYVPYHSARIEMCPAAAGDNSKKGKVFLEMLNYCVDQIRAPSCEHRLFMRCDVNFDVSTQGRNLNTFIGRAAHIEFLESDVFARFIMWSFSDLFR
ncbi:uncharacterized protein LOC130785064 isoform X2 [Actinidia eriantha]|uniref:uncharacterized protein LOC130785064 isoform X2 n=1 Tax=Actinidia eriantha TaxID=165200 RepID=UPI0025876717|nr:uncharacterized protein LOC130785064 isoform X2 [Actinidia eriantha]